MTAAFTQAGVALDFDALMRLQHLGRAMAVRKTGPLTHMPGGFVHRRRGRGLEVNDIRPWLHGDGIRHIDRNATARTGVQHVRTFCDERDRSLLLLADFRPAMLFGTRRAFRSVAAAEALALAGWHALAEGGRTGVLTAASSGSASSPPGRGLRNMAAVFGLMTRAHAAALEDTARTSPPLAPVLEAAARLVPAGGSIVVATALDEPGDGFEAVMQWLTRRNDVRFIIIRDAFERVTPPGVYPFFTSAGRKGSLHVSRDRQRIPDERCAYLDSLGASAMTVDADTTPEAMAEALEALHV
jgi:uncharacterized protein (DUF58 family)